MNIRIGNDIQVRFLLRGPEGFEKGNVKQMKVYFINESSTNVIDKHTNTKYYCGEAFPQTFVPSEYSLHTCGSTQYYVSPYDKCSYSTFGGGFHDAHYWPYYNGFGVTPDKFTNYKIPVKPGFYQMEGPSYLAPSKLEKEDKRASAYFQAGDQLYCGPYKMIVVLVLYDQGWNKNDLHTYTIDYGVVFNLVSDQSGQQGNITIELDQDITSITPYVKDLYINMGSSLKLGQNDINGSLYDITINYNNGTDLNYSESKITKLIFTSSDPIVQVREDGTITTSEVSQDKTVTITVTDEKETASTTFNVHVKFLQKESIGFAESTNIADVDLNGVDSEGRKLFKQVSNLEGDIQVENHNTGYYLWIVSRSQIKSVTSSGFAVPLNSPIKQGDLYYYVCPTAQIATTWVINIKK